MIYTITLSPSLDYYVYLDDFKQNAINRSFNEEIIPGGKGINVSIILKTLGLDSVVLGFIGGFSGEKLKKELIKKELKTDLININGDTKINLKINSKLETAINTKGPLISNTDIDLLIDKLLKLNDDDYVVFAGSIPYGLNNDIYAYILSKLIKKKLNIIVDTTNQNLINTLNYHPFLIKPNLEELEEIFNEKLDNIDKIKTKCLILKELGAKNIIVSLGENGALMLTEDNEFIYQKAFKGKVVNTVGAGDSLIAGFIYQYLIDQSYQEALRFGCLCGSATAFTSGLASIDDIKNLKQKL